MRRRDFIKVIGGAAATWPVAARAQQAERTRRIGVLAAIAESDPSAQPMAAAFEGTLAQLGWTNGNNVTIEYRWSGSDAGTMRRQVAELIALTPDVIFVGGGRGLEQLLRATRSVPIVFAIVPDPLGSGFIESLSRPGGNATGFLMFEYSLSGKWLELLAGRNAGGGPSGSSDCRRNRPICGHTVRSTVARRGGYPGQHARRRRNRTGRRNLCAFKQWWPDSDSWRGSSCWSRIDPRVGGQAQTARGLPRSRLCQERWPGLICC